MYNDYTGWRKKFAEQMNLQAVKVVKDSHFHETVPRGIKHKKKVIRTEMVLFKPGPGQCDKKNTRQGKSTRDGNGYLIYLANVCRSCVHT